MEWTLGFALTEECRLSRQHAPTTVPPTSTHTESMPRCSGKGVCDSEAENRGTASEGTAGEKMVSSTGGKLRAARRALITLRSSVCSAVRRIVLEPMTTLLERLVTLCRAVMSSAVATGQRLRRTLPNWPLRRRPVRGGEQSVPEGE